VLREARTGGDGGKGTFARVPSARLHARKGGKLELRWYSSFPATTSSRSPVHPDWQLRDTLGLETLEAHLVSRYSLVIDSPRRYLVFCKGSYCTNTTSPFADQPSSGANRYPREDSTASTPRDRAQIRVRPPTLAFLKTEQRYGHPVGNATAAFPNLPAAVNCPARAGPDTPGRQARR